MNKLKWGVIGGFSFVFLIGTFLMGDTNSIKERKQKVTYVSQQIKWVGVGKNRILVRVDPVDLKKRKKGELVASLDMDFRKLLHGRLVNLGSIQVMKYNPKTGLPERYDNNMYQKSPYDCIIQFYDDTIPWKYPERMGIPTFTKGQGTPIEYYENMGRYYNLKADGKGGKLVWMHTQVGNQPSYYAIYFDALKPQEKQTMPPLGWVGDGSNRVVPDAPHFSPWENTNVCVTDWNGDGLPDLLIGNELGTILDYKNIGTLGHPDFDAPRLLKTEDGEPLNVGFVYCSPLVVDWDGDRKKDLLVGTEKECVVFFKNVGTNQNPIFRNMGLLQTDGKDLRIPKEPCPEHGEVFAYDYNPVPQVVDWNGDGKPDLLLGGYITGLVWYYENVGRDSTGIPILHFKGPLQADGKDLDVGWCASPCVADFRHSGKLDLIGGSLGVNAEGGQVDASDKFLLYYENIGTRNHPILTKRPFPKLGKFPGGELAIPQAVDWDGKGLLDLVVSVRNNLYLIKNVGTKTQPLFDVGNPPLHAKWGNDDLGASGSLISQFLDWNHDGYPNFVSRTMVRLNEKQGNPFKFGKPMELIPLGKTIIHPNKMGDFYEYKIMYDFDGDGLPDLIYGDYDGYVWFHKNIGTLEHPDFDTVGIRFMTEEGKPVKVGRPEGYKPDKLEFDFMQGARPRLAIGDMDGNGTNDLVIGDTYGNIWLFLNKGTNQQPLFARGTVLAKVHNMRVQPLVTDWDGGGKLDILAFYDSGQSYVFLNKSSGGKVQFDTPSIINNLPGLPGMVRNWFLGDLNRDGNESLFLSGGNSLCYSARAYIDYGYCEARVLNTEHR